MGPYPGDRRALSALYDTGYAKLNLALHVRGRLADGRHRIETLFAFCEEGDQLAVEPAADLSLTISGRFAGGLTSNEDNLALKAARALQQAAGVSEGAAIHLTKSLPIASGIGGGSADAAGALRLLTRLWNLDPATAGKIAPRLGADVPACLLSWPCRGDGAGDEIEPADLPELEGKPVLLVNPGIPLATADVFAAWDGVDGGPLTDWRRGRNDLGPAAASLVPEIDSVLRWLRARPGAEFVRLSGSGASCFALFADSTMRDAAAAAVPSQWWHLATRLR